MQSAMDSGSGVLGSGFWVLRSGFWVYIRIALEVIQEYDPTQRWARIKFHVPRYWILYSCIPVFPPPDSCLLTPDS